MSIFLIQNFKITEKYGTLNLPIEKDIWKTQYYLLYGRCFTMTVPVWLKDLKIEDVTFETNLGTFVFLHHPGYFFDI